MRTAARKSKVASSTSTAKMASANKLSSVSSKYASSARMATSFSVAPIQSQRWYASEPKTIRDIISEQVKASPVVVYMKGTPKSPQCGFSRAVVDVLRRENLAKYDYYNVLEDEQLRQGVKDFSDWPTIPQVYIGGSFVGGCDIILDMHGEGTLAEALVTANAEIQEH